jgi:hypothetical protein
VAPGDVVADGQLLPTRSGKQFALEAYAVRSADCQMRLGGYVSREAAMLAYPVIAVPGELSER